VGAATPVGVPTRGFRSPPSGTRSSGIAQVGRLYRDGSSVYGYTASGGYVTAKAPGDSLFGLVRSGLLVRRVDPKNPLCAWFERTERTEGGRG
jgi:hypothetical protein